jgi:hypothetical protein
MNSCLFIKRRNDVELKEIRGCLFAVNLKDVKGRERHMPSYCRDIKLEEMNVRTESSNTNLHRIS